MFEGHTNGRPPTIPEYELIRSIGAGGFGEVWLARGMTGAFRAIKIVWKGQGDDDHRFEREFTGIQRFTELSVREPRQLALLHVGRNDKKGFLYYVMELADDLHTGREIDPDNYQPATLYALSKTKGSLDPSEVVRLGVALAEALASLHRAGLVHRDIKLSNIILVGGVPKLADIGLVRKFSEGRTFAGTEGYIPPGGPGLPSADVYSCGKLLYELATGYARDHFPQLPETEPDHPLQSELLELEAVWVKACQPNPIDRYPSGAEMLEDLVLLRARGSVRRLRSFESKFRLLQKAALAAAVLSLLLFLTVGFAVYLKRQAERLKRTTYAATMSEANLLASGGNHGAALKALKALTVPGTYRDEPKGFEWFALTREADSEEHYDLGDSQGERTLSAVRGLEFSPDNKSIAIQRRDHVMAWNFASEKIVASYKGVLHFQWSPVGSRLYVQKLKLKPTDTLNIAVEPWAMDRLPPLFVGKTGARVVGFHRTGDLQWQSWLGERWEANEERSLPPEQWQSGAYLWNYAVDDLGDRMVLHQVHGRNHNAKFTVAVRSLRQHTTLFHTNYSEAIVHSVAISHRGQWVAEGTDQSRNLSVLKAEDGEVLWSQGAHAGQLTALRFSPDDRWLATGGDDGQIKIWNAENGNLQTQLSGICGSIRCLAWNSDASQLAAGTSEGEVKVWPLGIAAKPRSEVHHQIGYWTHDGGGMLMSSDRHWIAASSATQSLIVSKVHELGHTNEIKGAFVPLQFVDANQSILAYSGNADLVVCSLTNLTAQSTGIRLLMSTNPDVEICSVACGRQGGVFICDTDGGKSFWDFNHVDWRHPSEWSRIQPRWRASLKASSTKSSSHPGFVGISPEGDQVVWGDRKSGEIEIRDAQSSAILTTLRHPAGIYSVLLGPGGVWCAVGDEEDHVYYYDLVRKGPATRYVSVVGTPHSLAMGDHDTRVACGTSIGTVELLRTDTWERITVLRTADSNRTTGDMTVRDLQFAGEGDWLAARTSVGTVQLWHGR